MSDKIFHKADSIVEFSHKQRRGDQILRRIQEVRDSLGEKLEYREQVVGRACDDLLAEEGNGERFTLRAHVTEEIERLADADLPRYLFYRYRYDIYPKRKIVDDFPPCLQIEPASICNYRCVFCYQTDKSFTSAKNGHMGFMKLELFQDVIDQAQGQCEAITLASRGEPLSCPSICEMLKYASGKFLGLKINTNAWFLDERMAHAILQSDVNTLVFSADAAAEPLYSQLRVHGNLDRVLQNINKFQDVRAREYSGSRLITRVSGVRYREADQHMDDMERFWGGLVDQVAFVDYNPWENTYERATNDVVEPCSDLWRRMFVWFDGRVNPCDVDYKTTLEVGQTGSKALTEIWTGEQYTRLRELHLAAKRGELSPCNRCTLV